MSSYMPSFKNVYTFNLEQEENKPHPVDLRIASTVFSILKRFFENKENGVLYICDTSDGRGLNRKHLFDKWFRLFNDGNALKFDAQAQTPDYLITASIILLKQNHNITRLVRDFYALVANGMLPED